MSIFVHVLCIGLAASEEVLEDTCYQDNGTPRGVVHLQAVNPRPVPGAASVWDVAPRRDQRAAQPDVYGAV